jgi:hypothetical protein
MSFFSFTNLENRWVAEMLPRKVGTSGKGERGRERAWAGE